MDAPPTFGRVTQQEREAIAARRAALFSTGDAKPDQANLPEDDLFGLALSGGGIRSATFCLGILQHLAALKILRRVDYISTVSGGGYIGSWLSTWFRRQFDATPSATAVYSAIETALTPPIPSELPEAGEISWLRQYSNYLSPRIAMFSADSWSILTIWLRNTLLTQIPLILFLAALLAFPRLMLGAFPAAGWAEMAFFAGAVALILATAIATRRLRELAAEAEQPTPSDVMQGDWWNTGAVNGVALVCVLLIEAAYFGAIGMLHLPKHTGGFDLLRNTAAAFVGTVAVWALRAGLRPQPRTSWRLILRLAATWAGSAALFDLLVFVITRWFTAWQSDVGGRIFAALIGPPLFLLILSFVAVLMIGAAGPYMRDEVREWWSRLGAWLLILGVVGIAGHAASLLGPYAIYALSQIEWATPTAAIAWLGAASAGALGGSRTDTGGPEPSGWIDRLLPIAPLVFVTGIVLAIATGVDAAQRWLGGMDLPDFSRARPGVLWYAYLDCLSNESAVDALVILGVCAAAFVGLSRLIDVNEFSMNRFYRNRLVRGFLGATRGEQRKADSFTNLDPRDDIELATLQSQAGLRNPFLGPVHLINTAINLSNPETGKQERRAASFVFTPYVCGFHTTPSDNGFYRALFPGDRATVGMAMSISGAAASPNMGCHTAPAVAFLMTMFNVRLGWWFRNTAAAGGDHWLPQGPGFGTPHILAELFARAGDQSRYVYLSDGGHFENLGVYELLRRRCRFIIACDGEQDGDFTFSGLGGLVRKARADFGIEIEIDPSAIATRNLEGKSAAHVAVGTIRYPEQGLTATLVYLKASVTGDEPADIRQFQSDHREFPHQNTGDQFFSESQFESYRRLGYHVAEMAFRPVNRVDGQMPHPHQIFLELRQSWRGTPDAVRRNFETHARKLDELMTRLAEDDDLRPLTWEFYPEWSQAVRNGTAYTATGFAKLRPFEQREKAFAKAFYFCQTLLQLMENVYLDLDLEANSDHPDCAGWMNLFQHWAWSDVLRLTYAIAAPTYGGRFRRFCERHFLLAPSEDERGLRIVVGDPKPIEEAGRPGQLLELNTWEKQFLETFALKDDARGALCIVTLRCRLPQMVDGAVEQDEDLQFVVGFAVINVKADGWDLRWLRIQNHLRSMGLGRWSLKAMRHGRKLTMARSGEDIAAQVTDERFTAPDMKDHIRWVKRLVKSTEI